MLLLFKKSTKNIDPHIVCATVFVCFFPRSRPIYDQFYDLDGESIFVVPGDWNLCYCYCYCHCYYYCYCYCCCYCYHRICEIPDNWNLQHGWQLHCGIRSEYQHLRNESINMSLICIYIYLFDKTNDTLHETHLKTHRLFGVNVIVEVVASPSNSCRERP